MSNFGNAYKCLHVQPILFGPFFVPQVLKKLGLKKKAESSIRSAKNVANFQTDLPKPRSGNAGCEQVQSRQELT